MRFAKYGLLHTFHHLHYTGCMEELRTCIKCETPKRLSCFQKRYGRQAGQWETVCKSCRNDHRRAVGTSPSHQADYRREYYWNVRRWKVIEKKFGLSKEDFEKMRASQDNRCRGCLREFATASDIRIDHDRACCPGINSCGRCIRGMLCHNCNVSLGLLGDSIEVLTRLAGYLKR